MALRDHAVAGRLDAAELEERLGAAYAVRRRAELRAVLADLPDAAPARAVPAASRARPVLDVAPLLALAALLVAIWALTGAGYFWPVWPIGALALHALKHRPGPAHRTS